MHSAEEREENALNRKLKNRSKRSTYSVLSSVFVTLTKIQDINNVISYNIKIHAHITTMM